MNVNNLERLYLEVTNKGQKEYVKNAGVDNKIISVCQCDRNKAPIRYLLSAMLAKIEDETIDTRQPYPNLGDHSFAGRSIDETIIQPFIHKFQLPCNDTTAFLTPAFRTIESALIKSAFDKCRPSYVYYDMVDILDYVENHPKEAKNVLKRMLAVLTNIKLTRENRVSQLVEELSHGDKQELASEEITTLLQQHLQCKGSSRLPVLMVTAAYLAVQHLIGETTKPLLAHNAADRQTGAIGDVEITLRNENNTITCYEMKKKQVTTDDIYVCAEKIIGLEQKPDNYIVITTESISKDVKDLAYTFYAKIGVEIAVLDCIGFINHFLHFFHRYRTSFLDNYQQLVLSEPNSSVSQPLKEAFLSLRRVAESEV